MYNLKKDAPKISALIVRPFFLSFEVFDRSSVSQLDLRYPSYDCALFRWLAELKYYKGCSRCVIAIARSESLWNEVSSAHVVVSQNATCLPNIPQLLRYLIPFGLMLTLPVHHGAWFE